MRLVAPRCPALRVGFLSNRASKRISSLGGYATGAATVAISTSDRAVRKPSLVAIGDGVRSNGTVSEGDTLRHLGHISLVRSVCGQYLTLNAITECA